MSGAIIEKGVVLTKVGKIQDIGQHIQLPEGYEIVDAKGKYFLRIH
jgi:imidazolonepropionase-like amidohydrolase